MKAVAKAKYVRHSERKLRQVAALIRGKSVDESFALLGILKQSRKGADILENVLKSAVANAQNNGDDTVVSTDDLKVSTIFIDKGPKIKRIRARAQGRAFRIEKSLSHVTIQVED
jgi:large subunit ribosomal protein L22